MPVFDFRGPDGKIHSIRGPEGSTPEQAFEALQKQLGSGRQTDPAMQRVEKSAAFSGGVLEGIPIIGPAIKGGAERLAAGLRSVTGGGSYEDELKNVQAIAGGAAKAHPTQQALGELTGGVAGTAVGAAALPRAFGMGGASLPAQMLRQMASGAGIGAADAVVRGQNPAVGAGVGAAGGVVGPLIGRGVEAVTRPIAQTVRGAMNPETEAARNIVAQQQAQGGQRGLTPQQYQQARAAGMPVMQADIGGEPAKALARSAANVNPQARDRLTHAVDQRYEQQGQRINQWFNSRFHYPDAAGQQRALEQVEKTTNQQAYRRAYAQGAQGIWSPELERLASSDAVAGAMKSAISKMRDESIVSGYGGMRPQVSFTPDGRVQIARGARGVPTYPDLQFWDLTRRELSDSAKAASRAGRDSEARRLGTFATNMNAELDRLIPSYAQARSGAASFFRAENALEAGQKAATQRMKNAEMRAGVAKMTDLERRLFQDGFVSKYMEKIAEIPNKNDVARKIAQSPAEIERLHIAIGRERTNELLAMLHVEGVMNMTRDAIKGNSTTARQLMEMGMASGVLGAAGAGYGIYEEGREFYHNPVTVMTAALLAGARYGHRVVSNNVAMEVARLLTSQNPQAIERGITMVANNRRLMDSLASVGMTAATRGAPAPIQRLTVPVPFGGGAEKKDEGPRTYAGPQQ